ATDAAGTDTTGAPGLALPVVTDTLENGLRVLALRRPGAPTVSFVLRFEVGSVNEVLGQTGIAHLLEHLLFKGTTTIGTTSLVDELLLFPAMDAAQDSLLAIRAGHLEERARVRLERRIEALEDSARTFVLASEWDAILTEQGARNVNAATSYESTSYFGSLPSNRAELWFIMEADRMANPVFREFYAERDVVAEERRTRLEADPAGRLTEEFFAAAYRVHPYGVPVIGHMSDILTHTRAEVAGYHARYYRPNNAILVVVGDIDPKRALRWARRYFGPIPAGDVPPLIAASEPPQRGERRVRVVMDAQPELLVGWRIPDVYHRHDAALNVLTQVLAGGNTSRLHRRLVLEDQLATSVTASLGPAPRGPRLFYVASQPLGDHTAAEVERAIYDEIARLAESPPTERELERVRLQIESSDVRRLGSHLGLAFQLAESVAYYDDWRETFRLGERLRAVTAEDVQEVARRYLTENNRTVAELRRETGGGV
ncbi:MAG: M16 family metallopeptidase, partial [Gemmatimonadota bacterium]